MNDKDKKILVKMAKSMHKAIAKALHYNESRKGKDVVSDVIDPNFKPEADSSKIPPRRTGVMYKAKHSKEDVAKKAAQTIVDKYKEYKEKQ
jgi:hypothetical protein